MRKLPQRITGYRSRAINDIIEALRLLNPLNTRTVRYVEKTDGLAPVAVNPEPYIPARKSFEIITVNGTIITVACGRMRVHYYNGFNAEIGSLTAANNIDGDEPGIVTHLDVLPSDATGIYVLWFAVYFTTDLTLDWEWIVREIDVNEPVDYAYDVPASPLFEFGMYFPIASFESNKLGYWRLKHVYHIGDIDCWPHLPWYGA